MHNHPNLLPGGAEGYALELYKAMRASSKFEPLLIARIGSNVALKRSAHPGAPFSMVSDDPNQYLLFTETEHFDFFLLTLREKDLYSTHFADFLRTHRPDVVHFQHTLFIGFDAISQVRFTLGPATPILYTLHEFLPICHRDGQMVRTRTQERCMEQSPRRCNECFPEISPQAFFLRKRFIRAHFDHVDLFLAPSKFLRDRYIDWGIEPDRIRFEDYGRIAVEATPAVKRSDHRSFGFFGQLNPFKGVLVLLRAMKLLTERGVDLRLSIYGANLDLQTDEFQREFKELLQQTKDNVTYLGKYEGHELPQLMRQIDWVIVPSVWWENSPLVIQEAALYGRPVICSDVGGMAEKVDDQKNGIHFRAGDHVSLANALERAAGTDGLWESYTRNINPVFAMDEHISNLEEIYEQLCTRPVEAVAA